MGRLRTRRKLTTGLVAAIAILGALAAAFSAQTVHHIVVVKVVSRPAASSLSLPASNRVAPDPRNLPTAPSAEPAAAASALPRGAEQTFSQLEAGSGGQLGVAVAPLGQGTISVLGSLTEGHGWSAMKVPVLATLLRQRGSLDSQQQAWAQQALTASDNQAATALFGQLQRTDGGLVGASGAVQQTLNSAGDDRTRVNTAPNPNGFTTFGQTEWSAEAATRFFRALARGCLLSSTQTRYVVGLMGQVIPSQRWGMGQVALAGAPVALKGGWGPENGGPYLVRQSAIVGQGNQGYVVTILARAHSGGDSFAAGTALLNDGARWVAEHIKPNLSRPAAGC